MLDGSLSLQKIATTLGCLDDVVEAMKEPAAAPRHATAREFVAPRDGVEARLAALWAEALGVERVGVHDDFFALGGHSLLALQLLGAVRDLFDVEVPLAAVFVRSFTVAELAQQVESARSGGASPDEIGEVLEVVGGMSDADVEAMLAAGSRPPQAFE